MKKIYSCPPQKLWEYHDWGMWTCVTTNGMIDRNDEAIMGKGVALAAKERYPNLPKELAEHIHKNANTVGVFERYKIITVPTKYHWRDKSDLELIQQSVKQLNALEIEGSIYCPIFGTGNGGLSWEQVGPIMEQLDDRFNVLIGIGLTTSTTTKV